MTLQASTLIVPVENQLRELDAKLLLSCIAAERGFPVVLGSRAFVHYEVASIPRGVYLAKSMRPLSDRMFDILRKLGHEIVAWDEEALVRAPDSLYWKRRLSDKTIQKVSALFAWGPDDARAFRDYPGYTGAPIHITGNPRVDMIRREIRPFYDEAAENLRERFGQFVLVNTNFGWNNHFLPNFIQKNNNREGMDEFTKSLIAHRSAIFEYFKEMLPALSKALPESTILVRPHPVESQVPWRKIAGEYGNVKVVSEGTVIPWLMACQALVHNSCTTGIEAFVLGTPAIAYQPVRLESFDDELPNSLSHRAFSTDELAQMVRSIASGDLEGNDCPDRWRRIHRHIAALDGPLAAERMVDVLEQAGYADRLPPTSSPSQYLTGWVHTKVRTGVKKINQRRSGHRNSIDYHAQRFPDVTLADLRGKIERLGKQLDRFEKVRIRQISRHIFGIDQ
jgi:surface carbohydrate biosynthesis protein